MIRRLPSGQVYQEPVGLQDQGHIWSDADAGTYTLQYGDGGPPGEVPNYAGSFVQPYTSNKTVLAASVWVTMSGTRTDGLVDPIGMRVDLLSAITGGATGNDVTYALSAYFAVTPDGVTRTVRVPLAPSGWGAFVAAIKDRPGLEFYFVVPGGTASPLNRVVRIYEAGVDLTVGGNTPAPPARLSGRMDGRFHGARRMDTTGPSAQTGFHPGGYY